MQEHCGNDGIEEEACSQECRKLFRVTGFKNPRLVSEVPPAVFPNNMAKENKVEWRSE